MGKGKKRDVGPSEPGVVPPSEHVEPAVAPAPSSPTSSSSHPPPVSVPVPVFSMGWSPDGLVCMGVVVGETGGVGRSASAESAGSTTASTTADICRICHCEGLAESPLITPCYCSGSLEWVHQRCLQQWIKSSQTRSCEVCRYSFLMHTKLKPFRRWEKLDISSVERRKILCSVTFHVIAITCVVWSLYVLIDRTAEEISAGNLEWPFWTKLVVVAIGFTGGIVFMYVQCKMYLQLFRRWKAYNKVIYVQNCPDAMTSKGPTKHSQPQQPPLPPHVVLELKPHHTVHITPAPSPS